MSDEIEIDLDDLEKRMDGALSNLRTEFLSLRTGRASASMLDPVQVEVYGAMTPVNQCATVQKARCAFWKWADGSGAESPEAIP